MAYRLLTANVKVVGGNELARAWNGLPQDVQDAIAKVNAQLTRAIINDAKHWAQVTGKQQVRAAAQLESTTNPRTGKISLSSSTNLPYAMGAEYGSNQYRQFKRWRGAGNNAGYFLWPALRDNDAITAYSEMLATVIKAS